MVTFIVKAICKDGVKDVECHISREVAEMRCEELDRERKEYHVVEPVETVTK